MFWEGQPDWKMSVVGVSASVITGAVKNFGQLSSILLLPPPCCRSFFSFSSLLFRAFSSKPLAKQLAQGCVLNMGAAV